MRMNRTEREQFIIDNYQAGEDEMIALFVEWCHNHDFDPLKMYREAYAEQELPERLVEINKQRRDVGEIETALLLEVLQMYGNDTLAFVVSNYAEKIEGK